MLHETMFVHSTGDTSATIASYQGKQSKFVNILNTLHKDVVIPDTIMGSASLKLCSFITSKDLCGCFGSNVQAVFSESCFLAELLALSSNCKCGAYEQTADHVLTACPIHLAAHGARGLTVLDDETQCWLNDITASI